MVSERRKAGFFGTLILGVIFTPVGFCVVYFWGLPMLREAKASADWPTVDGVITVARVESEQQTRKGKTTRMYSHHIEYRYSVDGETLTGDRVWISDGNSSSNISTIAQKAVASYPVGKEVQVHYDPAAPAVCVLEPGTTWTSYMPLGIGGLFFAIGLCLLGSLLWKIVAGIVLVGAAATTYASAGNQAKGYASDPPANAPGAGGDDGISIGE